MGASFVDTITSQTLRIDVTKTFGAAKDLSGLCTDIFLIVIRMREAEDLGEPAALRKLIGYFLNLLEKNCKATGISSESIFDAKYALVALIDETVLSIPGVCRDYWFSRPLQLDLFGDNIAGEEFYNKLQKLLLQTEKKKDVLEVYYICLSLGFEGKYKLFNLEERHAVIDDLGRKLRRTRIRASTGLSPHGSRADNVSLRKKNSGFFFPIWLSALILAAITGGLYAVLIHFSNSQLTEIMTMLNQISFK